MGHTVIVEKLFSWPGVGSLLVDSIFQRDIPVTQGCIFFLILIFLLVNLAVDLLYAVIDPRIDYR
jgi:ABC-type dipeptide/oligopeptide/nickel transport system permease component